VLHVGVRRGGRAGGGQLIARLHLCLTQGGFQRPVQLRTGLWLLEGVRNPHRAFEGLIEAPKTLLLPEAASSQIYRGYSPHERAPKTKCFWSYDYKRYAI
jgi:hypothetical protein